MQDFFHQQYVSYQICILYLANLMCWSWPKKSFFVCSKPSTNRKGIGAVLALSGWHWSQTCYQDWMCQEFQWKGSLDYNQRPTLPETNSSPLKMDGWNTTFLLGRPIFRGYVSFREGKGVNNLNQELLEWCDCHPYLLGLQNPERKLYIGMVFSLETLSGSMGDDKVYLCLYMNGLFFGIK